MAEQQQQQQTQAPAGPTQSGPAPSPSHPAVSIVETMLSRGERSPRAVASVVEAHPDAQTQILELLHATAGNAFVQEVTTAQTKTDEAPKAEDVALGPVKITASTLRIRSSPSTGSKQNIVGRLSRGSIVTPVAKDGDWLRIEHNGQTAFIHGDYVVSMVAPPKTAAPPKTGGDEDDAADEQQAAEPVLVPPPVASPPIPELPPTTPTKVAAPDPAPQTPTPIDNAAPVDQALPVDSVTSTQKGFFSKTYNTGTRMAQVFVAPGGVSTTPNIYIHFHGYRTDYDIDEKLKWEKEAGKADDTLDPTKTHAGLDVAREATQKAANRNTIAILPQGVFGEQGSYGHSGGFMADLNKLGLSAFLDKILKPLAVDLGIKDLAPGNIALGGHSAGGYEGVHSAMKNLDGKDKDLADNITDITLYDANYGGSHLDDAVKWMVKGPGGKTLRLVNGPKQQASGKLWEKKVGADALKTLARGKKMTVREGGRAKEQVDGDTTVMQHTQLINADGAVQCDVLVMKFHEKGSVNNHEALRDRLIDDAIMSIGEGAEGNKDFGDHQRGELRAEAEQLQHESDDDVADGGTDDNVAATADTAKANVPQVEHVEGDNRAAPETVKEPEAVAAPSKRLEDAAKKHKGQAKLFDRLYNEENGAVRLDKLGRHTRTKVKGKDVDINLTDAQYKFKQDVYVEMIERVGKGALYGGVDEKELADVPGSSQKIRKSVLPDLTRMLDAMNDEGIKAYVSSGYRPPEEDFEIWNSAFDRLYLWKTKKERERRWPDDPFGKEAVKFTAGFIAPRKAIPGTSNHSNGIAIDIKVKGVATSYDDQSAWRASKAYKWLVKEGNAARFNFKNWHKEAWHYDWTGEP